MSRSLYYLFVCFYFGCTLAHNLNSTARSYRFVQTGHTGSRFLHAVQYGTDQLIAFPLMDFIASYTGIATGYGFFAPQVGSSFQLEVHALDARGNVVSHTHEPIFAHSHNRLRFHSLLNRLQYVQPGQAAPNGTEDWSIRQARALAHCLAQRIAERKWGSRYETLQCTVSVYRHVPLRTSQPAHHQQRFIIYQHVIPRQYSS